MPLAFLTPDAPPASYVCRTIRIPADVAWLGLVNGALHELTSVENWEQFGELSPDETAAAFMDIVEEFHVSSYCRLGEIFATTRGSVPDKALLCDGSLYAAEDYPDLYALLDPAYVINPTTFRVPDLCGRVIVGAGDGQVLSRDVGETGGEVSHALIETELPSHSHGISPGLSTVIITIGPGAPVTAVAPLPFPTSTLSTGSGSAHNNMPPFEAVKYCIWALP